MVSEKHMGKLFGWETVKRVLKVSNVKSIMLIPSEARRAWKIDTVVSLEIFNHGPSG